MRHDTTDGKDLAGVRRHGWLAELLGCAVVLGGLAVLALPRLEARREQARSLGCDTIYTMLAEETRAEIETMLEGGANRCGETGQIWDVYACMLQLYVYEGNPRNRAQTAYTTAGDIRVGSASSCRVGLTLVGSNGIRFLQYVRPDSATSRTFSVVVE